jgi:hypothetical protein
MSQGGFSFHRDSKVAFTPLDSARDEQAPSIFVHFREERLKLPANAQQIRISRFRIDVGGNIYSIETQSFWDQWASYACYRKLSKS